MNFVTLISQLMPIVATIAPGAGQATLLATAAANIIAHIQQQKNLTTEQILQRAGAQLDANEVELLSDLVRLQGAGGGAAPGGTGGTPGSGSTTPGGGGQ
jgi:hypothetical protein